MKNLHALPNIMVYNKSMPKTGKKFEEFIKIVKELRKKCPWDREQTIESLKPYIVEEAYEAIQAIEDKDYQTLAEELGDMLLHIIMLSVFANEKAKFSIDRVVDLISQKMVRRHPHVFAKGKAKTKEEVWLKWERIKQTEKKGKKRGVLEGIPRSLPALFRSERIQRRVARVGFDWDRIAGAWEKVHEELDEVHELIQAKGKRPKALRQSSGRAQGQRIKEEIGDLLFAIVNVARKLNVDAEDALQFANNKFIKRFSKIEKALEKKKLSLAEMDALWEKAKAREA
jgi:tetrapyrrole methylase family protein/MazG family protein